MLRRKLAQKRKHISDEAPKFKEHKEIHKEQLRIVHCTHEKTEEERLALLEEAVLGVAEDVLETLPQRYESKVKEKKKEHTEVPQRKWEDSDDDDDDQIGLEVDNPSWAENFQDEDSGDSDEEALKSHSHSVLTSSTSLPSSSLAFKRVTNANKEDPASDALSSVQFHPKATVLLAASLDNTIRLFAVDGSKNRKIHSLFLERTSVMGAKFSRGGSEIIIGSNHKSFYIYDMEGSNGLTFRPKLKGLEVSKMSDFEISPDGRFIVFLGTEGYVHLFSQQSHELIESLKTNGLVLSAKFSNDGKYLYTFGEEGEVYVFNLDTRDCIHHFNDDGCVNGKSMDISPDGKYIALGSDSGIVNVYNHELAMSNRHPKPLKHIKNLTTSCQEALFNPQSELLALRSMYLSSGIRLVHLPSLTVLPNFPDHLDSDLKGLTTMNFSPSSGYLAIGNKKGKCLLYRLEHYTKY